MKNFRLIQVALILLLGLSFHSCQKDEMEHIDDNSMEIINSDSELTDLMRRASQNRGSYDNIIDGNSCTSVVLPVTVIANGQQIVVNTPDDIQLIHDIFDQTPTGPNSLEIMFPISLQLNDFSQVIVYSQTELEALAIECDQSSTEIDCLEFVYPITFFIYNSNNQQTGSVLIETDLQMVTFLLGLQPGDYYGIDFPIEVLLEDGSRVVVTSHQQLQALLLNCAGGSGTVDINEFVEYLTTGIWYVNYFYDDYDLTAVYADYEFSFEREGVVKAVKNGQIFIGSWEIDEDYEFEMDFDDAGMLEALDDDWNIIEATMNKIRLKEDDDEFLTFGREPYVGEDPTGLAALVDILTADVWYIDLMVEDGDDLTQYFVSYEFVFLPNGAAIATNANHTITGTWQAEVDDDGLEIEFEFEDSQNQYFDELDDDWNVLEFSDTFIKLKDDDDRLNFNRVPFGG